MSRIVPALALVASLGLPAVHAAEDRPEHYQGAESATLAEAFSYLEVYNEGLAELLAREDLTASDLNRIHQMTYTMENAVARLRDELEGAAASLEELHLASERADADAAREHGDAYLGTLQQFSR